MEFINILSLAFLISAIGCYAELSYNCSKNRIFLTEEFSLYYDTINPIHEVLIQTSLHQLRRDIGEGAKVTRVDRGHNSDLQDGQIRPKPKPKPIATTKHHHPNTKQHPTTKSTPNPEPHPVTTSANPEPHAETTTTADSISTTPRPVPVRTTTTPEGRRTTTPEGRRTTQTTTPEGRRTTQTTTTTPEGRRTTPTTTPEQRRTTPPVTTTPPPSQPIVIDLEVEVEMGRGSSLVLSIDTQGKYVNDFLLVIGQPITRLTANSLLGAIKGLEVLGQLMGTNQKGDRYLRECTVF
ncbi:hypothetical protein LOD99_11520 [Oopsacas minuta]|uniref:Uncharacterized protein n=1 Tax=Oopsacas minuta TaxID=111878 RepID=A0AAV7JL16_9METZ|nr:hypothetical protein LOD99_11520 [Oopsacas minuta]